MKKFFTLFILIALSAPCINAQEYDSSIDKDIRKQYNVEELPTLPNVKPNKTEMPKEIKNYNATGKTYTIKNGTKIVLISKDKVSNWSSVNSKISLLSQNDIMTKEGVKIPAGTLFKAVVTNSHPPQMTGNGGLITLKVNEIYYNGVMSFVDTKITEVNSKKVFKGDIKGKRKYWQNCAKAMKPGKKTFTVMQKAAKSLTPYPVINILSLVPLTIGGAAYIVNIPIAPAASAFMKGGAITIPLGTAFQVTFSGNNQIRG